METWTCLFEKSCQRFHKVLKKDYNLTKLSVKHMKPSSEALTINSSSITERFLVQMSERLFKIQQYSSLAHRLSRGDRTNYLLSESDADPRSWWRSCQLKPSRNRYGITRRAKWWRCERYLTSCQASWRSLAQMHPMEKKRPDSENPHRRKDGEAERTTATCTLTTW